MKKIRNSLKRSLTRYVIFSITIVLLYTIVEFIFSTITAVSHDTLTTCVYGFFAGEIIVCALIKIFKLKEGNDNGELSDS